MSDRAQPSEAAPPRMAAAGAAAGVLRARRQARGRRRRQCRGGLEGRAAVGAGASVDVSMRRRRRTMNCATSRGSRRGRIVIHRRVWLRSRSRRRRASRSARSTTTPRRRASRPARGARACRSTSIDKPAFCDFAFGAIVNRSPLVIGISTDGAAPVFAQAIRAKLEAMMPRGFARWAEAAQRWRGAVKALRPAFAAAARFWQLFTAHALAHPDRAAAATPTSTALSGRGERRRARRSNKPARSRWSAPGPGDPELLTLRAVRALQSADVILFDDLVSPEILDFARREAKKMLVGKTGHRSVLQAGRDQCADGRRSPRPASAWCGSRAAIR